MKSIGTILLGVFLLAYGLTAFGVPLGILAAVAALVAGIFILIGK